MDNRKISFKLFILAAVFFMFSCSALGEGEMRDASALMPQAVTNINQAVSSSITLDIKGMDILDVLKILSMKSGLNIVAGRNVTGKVTIFLKDVNIWDALEIILVSNNLAYEKKGSIVNVMTDRDYELIYGDKFYDKKEVQTVTLKYAKVAEISKALIQVKTNIGKIVFDEGSNTIVLVDIPDRVSQMKDMITRMDVPTQTKVFSLKYAKAEDIAKKITEQITKNIGTIDMDIRTNRIIVTDLPQQLEKIEKMISAFDQKNLQVMIEAKILEITLSDEYQMGIDWGVMANKYFDFSQTLKIADLTQGGVVKIGTIVGGGEPSKKGDYSALLNVLRTTGDVNTLSTPRIMALNNQESKILIGKKQPYSTKTSVASTQTTTTAESVTFVDLGVKLYVTPTINDDGFITMKIRPEVSSSAGDYTTADKNTIPIITTTEAETVIMVKDGATIIIAGLIKDTLDKSVLKVPVLGDIPLLGKIFSQTTNTKKKEEIVILLTPHIVTGESTFTEVARWQREEELLNKLKDHTEKEDAEKNKQEIKKQAPKRRAPEKKQIIKDEPVEKEVLIQQEETAAEDKVKMSLRLAAQKSAMQDASVSENGYNDYFSDVKKKIKDQIALFSDVQLKGQATAAFTLDKDGNLRKGPVIVKEDDKMLGDVLLESIKLASPFSSFGQDIDSQQESFTMTVSYE